MLPGQGALGLPGAPEGRRRDDRDPDCRPYGDSAESMPARAVTGKSVDSTRGADHSCDASADERDEPRADSDDNARSEPVNSLDCAKRDMTVSYGDRTFGLRAYRDGGAWHGVIIENKTPLRNALAPTADSASYFAAAWHSWRPVVERGRECPDHGVMMRRAGQRPRRRDRWCSRGTRGETPPAGRRTGGDVI